MNNATRKWIRAGLETLIHGGAAAVSSTLSAAAIDNKDWSIGSANGFKLAAVTFMANGGLRFFQWWQNNPLPEEGSAPPIPGAKVAQISLSPLSPVQPLTPQPPVDTSSLTGGTAQPKNPS